MRINVKNLLVAAAAFVILTSATALAQTGFGVRAGATVDPDQFHFGAHYITDDLLDHLHFRPNLEIGLGSNLTVVAANFEFAYRVRMPDTAASLYIGAGPALNIARFSNDNFSDTDSGGGFNILFGLEHRKGLFGELKVGTVDSPELKFTVGYTFK